MIRNLVGVLTVSTLLSVSAFAVQYRVVCAGTGGFGSDSAKEASPAATPQNIDAIATSLNAKIEELAKTHEVLDVSAPSASTSGNIGANRDYWGVSTSQVSCVTVKLK